MSQPPKKRGRPKLVLTAEEVELKKAWRRDQLARAQMRRRNKIAEELAQTKADLEQIQRRDEALHQRLRRATEEHERLLQSVENKDREIARLILEYERDNKTPQPGGQSQSSVPPAKLATVLLDTICNDDYRPNGITRARSADATQREADALASLHRQVRTAITTISKVELELRTILSDQDMRDMARTRTILNRVAESADIAKKKGRAIAGKRAQHEAALKKAAMDAIRKIFPSRTIEEKLLLALAVGPGWRNALADIENGKAFVRHSTNRKGQRIDQDILMETIDQAVLDAEEKLLDKLLRTTHEIDHAIANAEKLRQEIDPKRDLLRQKKAQMIKQVSTELVQRLLEKSNSRTSSPA